LESARQQREDIEAEYDAMQDPENLPYIDGQTIKYALQARKEMTMRVGYFFTLHLR